MSKRISLLTNVSDAVLGATLRAFRLDGAIAVTPNLAEDGTWTVQAVFDDKEENQTPGKQTTAGAA